MIDANELHELCAKAVGKPIQRHLRMLGFPNEKSAGGELFMSLLRFVEQHAERAETPTGFTVVPCIALTFDTFRELEKELGRVLCNSSDVIFGSIQITAVEIQGDPDGESFMIGHKMLDGRELVQINVT